MCIGLELGVIIRLVWVSSVGSCLSVFLLIRLSVGVCSWVWMVLVMFCFSVLCLLYSIIC